MLQRSVAYWPKTAHTLVNLTIFLNCSDYFDTHYIVATTVFIRIENNRSEVVYTSFYYCIHSEGKYQNSISYNL